MKSDYRDERICERDGQTDRDDGMIRRYRAPRIIVDHGIGVL